MSVVQVSCGRPAPYAGDVSLTPDDVEQFVSVFHFLFLAPSARSESVLRNCRNALNEVHFVPPNCTTSKRTPRMPLCAHRYTVEGCSFLPLRRRGTNGSSGTCMSGMSSSFVASTGIHTTPLENICNHLRKQHDRFHRAVPPRQCTKVRMAEWTLPGPLELPTTWALELSVTQISVE